MINNTKMTKYCRDKPSILYENCYCNQDEFDIVVCGGKNENGIPNKVTKLQGPDFRNSVKLSPMLTLQNSSKTSVIGSNIYVIGGYVGVDDWSSFFEVYSAKTNTWKELEPGIQRLRDFSVCSFMKSIYVVGGCKYYYDFSLINTIQYNEKKFQSYCYKYKANKWTKVADLQTERCFSACAVFEGKIVVTGGGDTKSIEAYDYYENKRTYLPGMIKINMVILLLL